MNIPPVNIYNSKLKLQRKEIKFVGAVDPSDKTSLNIEKGYVKVPKWKHDLEKWVFGVLTAVTVLQTINLLLTHKSNKFKI